MVEKCANESFPDKLLSTLKLWFACLSDALVYIHHQNVRHKDIKPRNILVLAESVYITDFGLARDLDLEATSKTEGYVFGKTPMYSPPEVISEGKRGRSADIFSLGCVFAEMATVLNKRSIFEFFKYRVRNGVHSYYETLDKVERWFERSSCFDRLIGSMISIHPENRPSAPVILLDWRVSGAIWIGLDLAGLDPAVSYIWTGLD